MSARLLTVAEVADQLGVSAHRVRADATVGLLPHRRVGRLVRFTQTDVDTYVDRMAVDRASTHAGLTQASRQRRRTTTGAR